MKTAIITYHLLLLLLCFPTVDSSITFTLLSEDDGSWCDDEYSNYRFPLVEGGASGCDLIRIGTAVEKAGGGLIISGWVVYCNH